MNTRRNHIQLLPTYIGTAVSFLAYLLLGAVPGILYGGYMGLVMSNALFGSAVEPSILARIVTGGGMALGLFASLFFFLVIGAFLGTVVGLPFAPILRRIADGAPQQAEVHAQAQHR
jgi:hypothetical protein